MTTQHPTAQLAAAIARAEQAEAARDSAYLAHNLTRQRLDQALQEVERYKDMPTCVNPEHTKPPFSQGEPAHHEVKGRFHCPCGLWSEYRAVVGCDTWELAVMVERQRWEKKLADERAIAEEKARASEPIMPFPGLGETATEFQLMANELVELRAYRDQTEAKLVELSEYIRTKRTPYPGGAMVRMGLWRLPSDRLRGDSSHDRDGGLPSGQGNEKAAETTQADRSQREPGAKPSGDRPDSGGKP